MPRRPRLILAGAPTHLVQRGVDRQPCFFAPEDRALCLDLLAEHAQAARCAVHAFVLMTNHVHLLITPETAQGPSRLTYLLGQRYVRAVDRAHGRTGTLWEGHFRSTVAADEAHVLACYRHVELDPVRAGLVEDLSAHPWSSCRANADSLARKMPAPHPCYLALGPDDSSRRAAHRALFETALQSEIRSRIRRATNANDTLGDDRFRIQVEAMLGRRIAPLQRGLKKKAPFSSAEPWPGFSAGDGSQRSPSLPSIWSFVRPPMRGLGRPESVTTTATRISLARGESFSRTSIASKWLRT